MPKQLRKVGTMQRTAEVNKFYAHLSFFFVFLIKKISWNFVDYFFFFLLKEGEGFLKRTWSESTYNMVMPTKNSLSESISAATSAAAAKGPSAAKKAKLVKHTTMVSTTKVRLSKRQQTFSIFKYYSIDWFNKNKKQKIRKPKCSWKIQRLTRMPKQEIKQTRSISS